MAPRMAETQLVSTSSSSSSCALMNQLFPLVVTWNAVIRRSGACASYHMVCVEDSIKTANPVNQPIKPTAKPSPAKPTQSTTTARTALHPELDDLRIRGERHEVPRAGIVLGGLVQQVAPVQQKVARAVGDVALLEQEALHVHHLLFLLLLLLLLGSGSGSGGLCLQPVLDAACAAAAAVVPRGSRGGGTERDEEAAAGSLCLAPRGGGGRRRGQGRRDQGGGRRGGNGGGQAEPAMGSRPRALESCLWSVGKERGGCG